MSHDLLPGPAGATAAVPSPRAAEGRERLAYRPALDGLRGVAVLAVVAAHLGIPGVSAGWLGVDVFFVISGYLITTLLLREQTRHGRIDLRAFWLARARRLLPAVVLVLAAVMVAARTLGLPARLPAVSGDVVSTFFYVANWRMMLSDEAYFATLASPSPLRHAWSLSVEEQYYLVYPLLLLLLLRVARTRVQLAGALALLAGVSALLMAVLYVPGAEPTRVYYGTDTRAFELFIGAVAAVLVLRGDGKPAALSAQVDRLARLAAPAALAAVVAAFVLADGMMDQLFRGGLVVFCLLCALVVVAAASWQSSPLQQLLSWDPLRRIGLISYGLYLWHWPVIVYLRPLLAPSSSVVSVYVELLLSFALALASYLLVERPIRTHGLRGLLPRAPRVARAVAAAACVALLAGAWALPAGVDTSDQGGEIAADLEYQAPEYSAGTVERSALLLGNSIPASYARYFPGSTYPDLVVSDYTNPGCDIFPDRRYNGDTLEPANPDCDRWRDGWAEAIQASDPDLVVVFVTQSLVADRSAEGRRVDFESEDYPRYLRSRLDDLREAVADSGERRLALLNLACHRLPDFGNDVEVRRYSDDVSVSRVNELVADWGADRGVPVIDQYSFLCSGGYHDGINGQPLYSDFLHVTDRSGPELWSWLAPRVRDAAAGVPTEQPR